MINDAKDKALLALLAANSRASIAELARQLGLSRSTVKDRIARLERRGIIKGYTLKLTSDYMLSQLVAHVMIDLQPKFAAAIVRELKQTPEVRALHAVNGIHDMLAVVSAGSAAELDRVLDRIGAMEGIEKTYSSIILSTKFER